MSQFAPVSYLLARVPPLKRACPTTTLKWGRQSGVESVVTVVVGGNVAFESTTLGRPDLVDGA